MINSEEQLVTLEELLGSCTKVLQFGDEKIPFDFYLCERHGVDPCKQPGELCAFDVAQNHCEPEGIKALAQACKDTGYAVRPKDWREAWLQHVCWLVNIEGEGPRRVFSAKHTTNRCRIELITKLKNYEAQKPYQQRSSAFDDCYLFRVWANILKNNLPKKFEETIDAKLGTAEHKLQNWQPPRTDENTFMHNQILKFGGIKPVPRANNEVELEYSIMRDGKTYTVRGHADGLLAFVNQWQEKEGIAVYDFKHAVYRSSESNKFKLQMLSYCLAVAQILNLEPKYFRLISLRTPFGRVPYAKRQTQPLMTQIPNKPTNEYIKLLHSEMTEGVEKQRELLGNLVDAQDYKSVQHSKKCNGCLTRFNTRTRKYDGECFSKKVCDFIFEAAQEQKVPPGHLLRKNNWVPEDYTLV